MSNFEIGDEVIAQLRWRNDPEWAFQGKIFHIMAGDSFLAANGTEGLEDSWFKFYGENEVRASRVLFIECTKPTRFFAINIRRCVVELDCVPIDCVTKLQNFIIENFNAS